MDKFYFRYLAIVTISKLVLTFSRVIFKKKRTFEFWKTGSVILFDLVSAYRLVIRRATR